MQYLCLSLKPFLRYFTRSKYPKQPPHPKNCHILGVDVLIDEKERCWLLEINANPSLNIEFDPSDKSEKRKLGEKMKIPNNPISEVDLYVKSK